jgi:hypothetical protein
MLSYAKRITIMPPEQPSVIPPQTTEGLKPSESNTEQPALGHARVNIASIYPMPAEHVNPVSPPPVSQSGAPTSFNTLNSSLTNTRPSMRNDLFAFIGGAGSVLLTVGFILIGKPAVLSAYNGGEIAYLIGLLSTGLLAFGGLWFGYLSQRNREDGRGIGIIGLALGAVMVVQTLSTGSSYAKYRWEISKLKRNNSSIYNNTRYLQ